MGSPTKDGAKTSGYGELVRSNRDFRNLWSGQIISLFGDWFNLIASAALVARLTGSGLAVGGLFVVRMLAPFLISPIAGVAADRYNRKHLLIGTDLARALLVLGFLFVRTPGQVGLLYLLSGLQLSMMGIFFPTRNAILPEIVSPKELGTANAITATTWSVMLAMGAAIGGLVAGGWGLYPAFVIDSLTFLLSAAFIGRVDYRPRPKPVTEAKLGAALGEYLDGLAYLKANLGILAIALHKAALAFFVSGAYEVIQVAIAKDRFPIGESGGISLGILYAVIGLGSGVGPIAARSVTGDRDRALRVTLLLCYLLMSAGLGIVSTLASFPLVLLGTFIRAFGGGTLWVFSTQLLLQLVPDRVRGRVFATEFALLTLAMASSAGLAGWLVDRSGGSLSGMLQWMALLVILPGLAWGITLAFSGPEKLPR